MHRCVYSRTASAGGQARHVLQGQRHTELDGMTPEWAKGWTNHRGASGWRAHGLAWRRSGGHSKQGSRVEKATVIGALEPEPARGSSGSGHAQEAWETALAWLVLGQIRARGAGAHRAAGRRRPRKNHRATMGPPALSPRHCFQKLIPGSGALADQRPGIEKLRGWGAGPFLLSPAPPRLTPSCWMSFTPSGIFSLLSPAQRVHPHERGDQFISVVEKCSHVRGSMMAQKSQALWEQKAGLEPQLCH